MPSQTTEPPKSPVAFQAWKLMLRKDCEKEGKLRAFDSLTDPVLKLLWESGLDPTVQAFISSASHNMEKPD